MSFDFELNVNKDDVFINFDNDRLGKGKHSDIIRL